MESSLRLQAVNICGRTLSRRAGTSYENMAKTRCRYRSYKDISTLPVLLQMLYHQRLDSSAA
jgi:hypothetical protein